MRAAKGRRSSPGGPHMRPTAQSVQSPAASMPSTEGPSTSGKVSTTWDEAPSNRVMVLVPRYSSSGPRAAAVVAKGAPCWVQPLPSQCRAKGVEGK